jgi:hypothetical protein
MPYSIRSDCVMLKLEAILVFFWRDPVRSLFTPRTQQLAVMKMAPKYNHNSHLSPPGGPLNGHNLNLSSGTGQPSPPPTLSPPQIAIPDEMKR